MAGKKQQKSAAGEKQKQSFLSKLGKKLLSPWEGSGGPDPFTDEPGNRYPIDSIPKHGGYQQREIDRRAGLDSTQYKDHPIIMERNKANRAPITPPMSDENAYNPRSHNGSFKFRVAFERKGYKVGE